MLRATSSDGVQISYEVEGQGPPVVCVMGFTGGRHQWLGFPGRLVAAGFRVVSLDNRGVGASDAPPGPYSTAQMARDVEAVLDHAGIERAHVVGVSMGGMVAQELALTASGRVDRLVLGCTHHGGSGHVPTTAEALSRLSPRPGRSAGETLRALLELNFSEAFMQRRPEVIDALVEHGLRNKMPHVGFLGQLAALAGHDAEGRIDALRSPTLVITGDRDRLVPPANSHLLARRIPGAELHLLPGVGHMFWVEAADEAISRIETFLCA